jgi:hypothetical protein
MLNNHLIHPVPIHTTFIHDLSVLFHRHRKSDAFYGVCNDGLFFGTLSLRHFGYSLGGVLANHASFLSKPQIPSVPVNLQPRFVKDADSYHTGRNILFAGLTCIIKTASGCSIASRITCNGSTVNTACITASSIAAT